MSNFTHVEEYIKEHPESNLHKTEPVQIKGKSVDIPVYLLPFDEQKLLTYNISNGRFEVQYTELVKKEGRELDPNNADDAKKIQQLLYNISKKETDELYDSLRDYGQERNSICTIDGKVINGNRRMAILQKLVDDIPTRKDFGFMKVGLLPSDIEEKDLWKIEAGIQMSRRVQLDYSPMNTLLKFKRGLDKGISAKEIAGSLYGSFTEDEILDELKVLQQITRYTRWLDDEGNYNIIEKSNIAEHFRDSMPILDKCEDAGLSTNEKDKINNILFQLIYDGEPVKSLRDISKSFSNPEIKAEMLSAAGHSTSGNQEEKAKIKQEAKENDRPTPTREIFELVKESLRNDKLKKEPEKLLIKIRKLLKQIDTTNSHLKSTQTEQIFEEINELIESIRDAIKK